MVLRVSSSLSDSQPHMRGVFFLFFEVSITGHEHAAHVNSRQQVHNEK
jgi:hypothetical protein